MKYGRLTLGQIEALVNKLGGIEWVQQILSNDVEVVIKDIDVFTRTFKMVVNYDLPVKESMEGYNVEGLAANYDTRLPDKGKRLLEFKLCPLNPGTKLRYVMSDMEKSGWRPATIKELLSFGNKYPRWQHTFKVISCTDGEVQSDGCMGMIELLCNHIRYICICGLDRSDYSLLVVRK